MSMHEIDLARLDLNLLVVLEIRRPPGGAFPHRTRVGVEPFTCRSDRSRMWAAFVIRTFHPSVIRAVIR